MSGVHSVLALQQLSDMDLKSLLGLQQTDLIPVTVINTVEKACLLKIYYEAVMENNIKIEVKVFEHLEEFTVNDLLKETDLLTLTLNNTGWGSKLFEVILEVIFRSKVSSIILLDNEFDRQNALMLLKAKEGIQDFHIHQNFF